MIAPGYERVTGQRLTEEGMTCLLEREEKAGPGGNMDTLCILRERAKMIIPEDPGVFQTLLLPALPEKRENVDTMASAGVCLRPADARLH